MTRAVSPQFASGLVALCLAVILSLSASHAHAGACKALKTGTDDAPLFPPPLGEVVIGTGRLQFYSAPRCAIKDLFVVPHDDLTAYAETKSGWSSVMYINPRGGPSRDAAELSGAG